MGGTWRVVGVTAALIMWCVSAAANWYAGTQLAPSVSGPTAYILGGASISADVLKTVALFMLVASIAKGDQLKIVVTSVIMLLCVTWSLRSAVYFTTDMINERMAERGQAAEIAKARTDLIELRRQRAAFVSQQKIKLPGSGRPLREAILAERKRTQNEFANLTSKIETTITEVEKTAPRGLRDPIAAAFGIPEHAVLLATALAFALLVEFVSGAAFYALAVAPRADKPRKEPKEQQTGYGGVSKPPEDPPLFKPPAPPPEPKVELSPVQFAMARLTTDPHGRILVTQAMQIV